jgi:phage shock protein A
MSEDRTRDLSINRSFEERLFARFDQLDGRFDSMEMVFDGLNVRVQALESRSFDTKPIWERALAEILEVKQEVAGIKQEVAEVKQGVAEVRQEVAEVKRHVANIERKFDVLILDMMQLRGDQRRVNSLFDRLESNTA